MKGPDKFLIGIVAGVLVLVVVVLGVLLTRPQIEYVAADTAEGVAHNYLLALQREDYERAYSYLSPEIKGYPDSVTQFKRDLEFSGRWFYDGASVTLEILSFDELSSDRAVVEVRETRYFSGGLLSSSQYDHDFDIYLSLVDGSWVITDGDQYFAYCWNDTSGCK